MKRRTISTWRFLLLALFISAIPSLMSLAPDGSAQESSETLFSQENAYNPIPSPDGKLVAYVRTGWDRPKGVGGFGRADLLSDVLVMTSDGAPVTKKPLADSFLAGWTPDGMNLVCFRDYFYGLVTLKGKRTMDGNLELKGGVVGPERVAYIPSRKTIGWSRMGSRHNTLIEFQGGTIARNDAWLGEFLVPSPDGRYLAVYGEKGLWVYSMQLGFWFDLGPAKIVDDFYEWSYIQPSWSPWFADSSHLAFFTKSSLVISNPSGSEKTSIPIDERAGLATPSPDGKAVAYVTFDPTPMKIRPDLQFWGGTTIWVISTAAGAKPVAVTQKNPARTYDVKWLNDDSLLFDRVDDVSFFQSSHIWKVRVTR
ncbi:MAG TPA: hypothetical protein VGZ48_12845 [Candidatus Acidoferrales bacterium]|jgi:hypothetical protein|nr:hypothetical protein [Candidatus Acidoferrales bacterium]